MRVRLTQPFSRSAGDEPCYTRGGRPVLDRNGQQHRTHNWRQHEAGEVLDLDPHEAGRLVANGKAVKVDAGPARPDATKPAAGPDVTKA